MVSRDHPESLYPICYNAEASATILPRELREVEWRDQGASEEEIAHRIAAQYLTGELRPPARPAIAYMMSRQQVIYASPTSPRLGQLSPHLMVYIPFATRAQFGMGELPLLTLRNEGTPLAHVIVGMRDWSDAVPDRR